MLEIKNILKEMKKILYGFLSRIDTVRERNSGLEERPMETSKTEIKTEAKRGGERKKRIDQKETVEEFEML